MQSLKCKTRQITHQFSSMMYEHLSHLRVSILTGICQCCALGERLSIDTGTCSHNNHVTYQPSIHHSHQQTTQQAQPAMPPVVSRQSADHPTSTAGNASSSVTAVSRNHPTSTASNASSSVTAVSRDHPTSTASNASSITVHTYWKFMHHFTRIQHTGRTPELENQHKKTEMVDERNKPDAIRNLTRSTWPS